MHEITLDHPGLNRHRVIRGPDPEIVQRRADYVKAIWDEQWKSRLPAETARQEREAERRKLEEAKVVAVERQKDAEERRQETEARREAEEPRKKAEERTKEAEKLTNDVQEHVEPPRQIQSDTLSESDTRPEDDAADRSPPRDNTSLPKKEPIRHRKQDFGVKPRVLDYLWPFTLRRRIKADGDPNHAAGLG